MYRMITMTHHFILAACFGKEEVALVLTNEFGCDTNVRSQFGRSLLHNACERCCVNLVPKLIQY